MALQHRFSKSNADLAEELVDKYNENIEVAWENGDEDGAIKWEEELEVLIWAAENGFVRFKGDR